MKLINSCCLEALPSMGDNTADIVITSPPYNMNLRIRNGKYCSRQIVKELTTKYKSFSDNMTMQDYFAFNLNIARELLRVSDLVFYNIQFLTGNKPALFRLLGELHNKVKEFIVWDKGSAQPAIGEKVLNSQFEAIIIFQNSKPESRSFKSANFKRGTMSNVWNIKKGRSKDKSHGATFPIELCEKIILNFTRPDAVVLDPFMGTGTTGEASLKNGRDFVGVEIDRDYYNFAKKRLTSI